MSDRPDYLSETIVDKLTPTAYMERRSTLSNNGTSPSWTSKIGNNRAGKFFPRGCRGWIDDVEVYCRDNAAAGGTITVYLSPYIGSGHICSVTVTVPSAGAAAWRAAAFNVMWNYDSLFIFIVCSVVNIQYGYDSETPYDDYSSTDVGVTWGHVDDRIWVRVLYKGQTVGDLPVSGTVNIIEIPAASTEEITASQVIQADTLTTLITHAGMGYCDLIIFEVAAAPNSDHSDLRVHCDGVVALDIAFQPLAIFGCTASTPNISLTAYAVDGYCCMIITKKFEFRLELKISAFCMPSAQTVSVYICPNDRK